MSFPKGSLNLNRERDYPLLERLGRSGFATHSQMFEFMQIAGRETSRQSFNWRVLRLVQHNLIRRQNLPRLGAEHVYALTTDGSVCLEGAEDRFALISLAKRRDRRQQGSIYHSLELNDIELSIARQKLLAHWVSAVEIRSENELTHFATYRKDYDAIATLRLDGREIRCALEYERSAKARREYDQIAETINGEQHVDHFLYLTANEHLLRFVSWSFRNLNCQVYFGMVGRWHDLLLDMPVFSWKAKRYVPLKMALADSARAVSNQRLVR